MDLINKLMGLPEGEEEDEESEMERGDKEFIISELLKLAVNLDYADETGRRKMFALVRKSYPQNDPRQTEESIQRSIL